MPYASSLKSYPDIIKALDRALESRKGVRLHFESAKAAMTFCGRVHNFRHLDRKANTKIYPADHPMHGCSAYDDIMTKKGPNNTVELVKLEGVEFTGEDIE